MCGAQERGASGAFARVRGRIVQDTAVNIVSYPSPYISRLFIYIFFVYSEKMQTYWYGKYENEAQ